LDPVLSDRPIAATLLAAVAAVALLGSGCESTGRLRAPPPTTAEPAAAGATHVLDAGRSELHLLVYRAGTFARFGHNHVIAARDLEGQLTLTPGVAGSTFELLLPVERLEVDPARWRTHYGEDFASTPSAADIDGTRANMLGAALLDAAAYPFVRVAGRIVGDADAYRAELEIAVKDTVARRATPVTLAIAADTITASGSLTVTHAELGLTPFSVMLGALRVAEEIEIRFELVAERVGPAATNRPRS